MDLVIPRNLMGSAGESSGAAISQAGREISRAGNSMAVFFDNVQKNIDYNNAVGIKNESELEKQKYSEEFWMKEDGSKPDSVQKFQEGLTEIDRRYSERAYKFGDRVGGFVDKYNQVRTAELTQAGQKVYYKKMFDKSQQMDLAETDLMTKQAINSGEINFAMQERDKALESRRSIYGDNVDGMKTVHRALMAENFIKGRLANPSTAPAMIQAMNDPAYKANLFQHIPAGKVDEIEKLLASKGKDTLMQNAYNALYAKHNGNFTAMNDDLTKPQTQKELGLGLEESFYVKRQISDAQADKDKADNIRWNQNATQVFLNLSKTTPGQIDQMVQRGDLSYQLGEHFKKEKKEALTGGPSDPYAWFRAYTKIKDANGDPDTMTKVRNEVFAMGGLSFADKKDLIKLTESTEDKYESGMKKKGMDYIKSVVMPSQTMISAAKPAEAQKFLEASMAFERGIDEARKRGEKITPEYVEKFSKQVASTYSMTIYDQMDAVTQAQRAAKAKKAGGKKDQYGFVVGETRIVNGKTYKYIGNDQWQ